MIINIFKNIPLYFLKGLWIIISFFPKYLYIGILTIFRVKNKPKIKKGFVSNLLFFISFGVYLSCVFVITRRFVQTERTNIMSKWVISDTESLSDDPSSFLDDGSNMEPILNNDVNNQTNNSDWYYDGTSFKSVDINRQKMINPDTVGWIWVNGTNINYPVVQSTDNSYYLNHDYYKNNYFNGAIFADYRVDFNSFGRNTIIYGHNSLNNRMFSQLNKLLRSSWFSNDNNNYIRLSSSNTNSVWQIFSVYTIEPEIYYLTTGFTDETFETYIKTMKSRSSIYFDVDVSVTDKVLTLQTCNNAGDGRIVIQAKLIKIEEK